MRKLYEFLDISLYRKGITKKGVARSLGISEKALRQKIKGESPFNWNEAEKIKALYFPEIPIEELFQKNDKAG